jgi:hypothetical protein
MPTVTLISATPGDTVPGRELADPQCPEIPGLLDLPEVAAFLTEHNYGPDEPTELMYLVTDDAEIPTGFPTLTFNITTRYTHAIETSTDGDTWQTVRLADTPEEYDGTADTYGHDVLVQWIADEYPEGTPADEYGNPLLRVVVYPADTDVLQHDSAIATVYPDTATA